MTTEEEKNALVTLVAPWLPNAEVDELEMSTQCGCYSEYTTEPCNYWVTFRAPRPPGESDRELSNIVRVLEGPVMQFAMSCHNFEGCSCCCDEREDGDYSHDRPSLWVRVIPLSSPGDADDCATRRRDK